jgi:regulator of replication initiation timing
MDFNKLYDYLTPQGLKDVISNLKTRVSQLIDQNEDLFQENIELRKRTQQLEDQLRMLKGEKPIPKFTDKKPDSDKKTEISSDKKKKDRTPRRIKIDLVIDKTISLKVDRTQLPPDAIHKGYRRVTIQEILFERHNLCFELERFLDPTSGKIIEAKLPVEYTGHEFGPTLRSFIVSQYFECDSTHHKIKKLLAGIDINISTSSINNILLQSSQVFEKELKDLRAESLKIDRVQHIDDTSWKVQGASSVYTIVTGNKFFTQFATVKSKSRSFAIWALSGKNERKYRLNERAVNYAITGKKSLKLRLILESMISNRLYDEDELDIFMQDMKPYGFPPATLRDIKTGMYLAALRAGDLGVYGSALMSDDAGQFNYIFDDHGLCWVHELRHYKLIEALNSENKMKIDTFLSEAWELYRMIKIVRTSLSPEGIDFIFKEFKRLFEGEKTGFKKLDHQRKLSAAKMDKLLAPLFNSSMPMHNNAAELDVRGRVIKRKISMFNKSWRGAGAWDTYLGLKESCRKLGINFYQRVLGTFKKQPMKPLWAYIPST